MIVSKEEAEEIIWEDHEDWEMLRNTRNIICTSRWTKTYEAVFLHKPTQKHYQVEWNVGATEIQEGIDAFYSDEVELTEVELKEVMVKQWVPV